MKERIQRIIDSHNLYWRGEEPLMSDIEYDKEIEWLKKKKPNHWLLKNLGVSFNGDIKHAKPMLSLQKAYSFNELKRFIKRTARTEDEKYYCQIKFDGMAACWENEILSTRGDGKVGKDITDKLSMISCIQGKCKIGWNRVKNSIGEIVCPVKTFKEKGGEFKTPRNFVAGLINKKETTDIELHFVEYSSTTKYFFTAKNFTEEKWDAIKEFFEEVNTYPADGLVIKLADSEYGDGLGCTEHHPLSAIAFKFANEQTISTLLSVDWQPGRNKLTPVANIEPVELGGVIIRRATLHNYQHVKDLDIHIGDEVVIERSGDVIPHLLSATRSKKSAQKVLVSSCPICGHTVDFRGPDVCCRNFNCPGVSFARFMHAIKEFNIEFIGEGVGMKLFKAGIKNIFALFKMNIDNFVAAEISPKIAVKILKSIKERSVIAPEYLLSSLAIDGLGKATWRTILEYIPFNKLIGEKLKVEELLEIPGIEFRTARKIRQGLIQKRDIIDEYLQVVTIDFKEESSNKPQICFTGKMPEKRSFYQQLAQDRGYQVVDNITKDVKLLIVADIESGSSKIQKAKKNNIQIQTLEEWLS